MLCLARAIRIWGNEIMPAFMAWRTQERLWPTIGFVSEEMKWSPVMAFCAIGAAHFALMLRMFWLYLTWIKIGSDDNLFRNEVGSSMPTITHEKVLNRATLVFALNYLPCFSPATLWAWIVRPLKGFFRHG